MRVIKFRCWDFSEKKMYYEDCNCKCRNAPVMQSTGLCDKNGKDLDWWEGDIVKTYGETYKENWLIIKDQGCFWLERIVDKFRVPCYEVIAWGDKKEVIGNIRSTPELMEKAE